MRGETDLSENGMPSLGNRREVVFSDITAWRFWLPTYVENRM
jgi:hypothetical protein